AFEAGAREPIEGPALGAVVTGRFGAVQRTFAFAPIERSEVPAAERHPHDAVPVDVRAAHAEAGQRRYVDFGERGLRRIRARVETNDRTGVAEGGSPYRVVDGARHHGIETGGNALVLRRIDGLVRLD